MSEASSTGSYGPIEPGRLVEERVARFYVRLGLVVAIAIGAASALVWTGTF